MRTTYGEFCAWVSVSGRSPSSWFSMSVSIAAIRGHFVAFCGEARGRHRRTFLAAWRLLGKKPA